MQSNNINKSVFNAEQLMLQDTLLKNIDQVENANSLLYNDSCQLQHKINNICRHVNQIKSNFNDILEFESSINVEN